MVASDSRGRARPRSRESRRLLPTAQWAVDRPGTPLSRRPLFPTGRDGRNTVSIFN
jgi:hypothetical protein